MQVILMEKMANLGQLGDVVKVKDGYARNYLIPQGKAKRATETNLSEFAARRVELEAAEKSKHEAALATAEKLGGLTLQIVQKAGVDGKLFGSVTNADIAAELKKQDFAIEKSQIRMPEGHFKQVGDYEVEIALHSDVVTSITVAVLGEQ